MRLKARPDGSSTLDPFRQVMRSKARLSFLLYFFFCDRPRCRLLINLAQQGKSLEGDFVVFFVVLGIRGGGWGWGRGGSFAYLNADLRLNLVFDLGNIGDHTS